MTGWQRLLILISIVWFFAIVAFSYHEYPTGGRFGGIPIGSYYFWTIEENPFNQFDQPNDPPGPFKVKPKIEGYVSFLIVPIIFLWLVSGGIVWVKKGFTKKHNP